MEIRFTHNGKWSKTSKMLENMLEGYGLGMFDKYGREGVRLLQKATPRDTGDTARGWYYTITEKKGHYELAWCNNNISDGAVVALLIQYGHATKDGYFLKGQDYINPAMRPLFDKIAEKAWEEVTNS